MIEPEKQNSLQRFSSRLRNFNFDEFLFKYRWSLTLLLIGAILVGFGVIFAKGGANLSSTKVEVLESATETQDIGSEIVVEVSGAVESPGVYKFSLESRVEDVLIAAGGVSVDADRGWMEKFLNRAAKISDGQKIYIPREGEEVKSTTSNGNPDEDATGGVAGDGLININTASQKELESLWGIGPVYAQNIIEQRPYSSIEELLTRKILKRNVYERNKDRLTVY